MITTVIAFLLAGIATASQELLWNPAYALPASSETTALRDVRFAVIKPFEPDWDAYRWLHGVAVAWHQGTLYASYGVNEGAENTATERIQIRVSDDGGDTWAPMAELASGDEGWALSHGVFAPIGGRLHAFFGYFRGFRENIHMRGYMLDDESQTWEPTGVLARDDFWPMAEPKRLRDGTWIVAGIAVTGPYGDPGNPAAMAISQDASFRTWDVVRVPRPDARIMWGESAVIADGNRLTCIARADGSDPIALVSYSEDGGRTWTPVRPSNLPMAASKPYAGMLSTGQRYLICTTTADVGNRRFPLTIAVSSPGESLFSKVYRIRDAQSEGPGESHPSSALSYPYAVEHDGSLYIAYSNDGGRGNNANSAELAVVPIAALQVP